MKEGYVNGDRFFMCACGKVTPLDKPITPAEREVIEAAEVLTGHNVLYFAYGYVPYSRGSNERAACDSEVTEFRALKAAVERLRAERAPKPRWEYKDGFLCVDGKIALWDKDTIEKAASALNAAEAAK
jgi:hypothetical protein